MGDRQGFNSCCGQSSGRATEWEAHTSGGTGHEDWQDDFIHWYKTTRTYIKNVAAMKCQLSFELAWHLTLTPMWLNLLMWGKLSKETVYFGSKVIIPRDHILKCQLETLLPCPHFKFRLNSPCSPQHTEKQGHTMSLLVKSMEEAYHLHFQTAANKENYSISNLDTSNFTKS